MMKSNLVKREKKREKKKKKSLRLSRRSHHPRKPNLITKVAKVAKVVRRMSLQMMAQAVQLARGVLKSEEEGRIELSIN